jgi:hypothetical protein
MSDGFIGPSRADIEGKISRLFTLWHQQLRDQDATPDVVLATGHTGPMREAPQLVICMPQDASEGGGLDEMIDRVATFLMVLTNQRNRLIQDVGSGDIDFSSPPRPGGGPVIWTPGGG